MRRAFVFLTRSHKERDHRTKTVALRVDVWMEVSGDLQLKGHSWRREQQVQWYGGVRYLCILKFRGQGLMVGREQQWEGEAGKVGRGQIVLSLKGQANSEFTRGLEW